MYPESFLLRCTSHQIHRKDLPFIDNSEISFLFWITHPNMSALNHIANRESIYKLFFCSQYFCGDQNQFMAKFFFNEKVLNLAGSNYHFGKCSVENWLVKELFESSFEDTLIPPISWGFHLLFVCVFTFV